MQKGKEKQYVGRRPGGDEGKMKWEKGSTSRRGREGGDRGRKSRRLGKIVLSLDIIL